MTKTALIFGERQALAICNHLKDVQEAAGDTEWQFRFIDRSAEDAEASMIDAYRSANALVLQVHPDQPLSSATMLTLLGLIDQRLIVRLPFLTLQCLWPYDMEGPMFDGDIKGPASLQRGDKWIRQCASSLPLEDVKRRVLLTDYSNLINLNAMYSADVSQLIAGEGSSDVHLAAYFEDNFRKMKLFEGPISPSNTMMRKLISAVVERLSLSNFNQEASDNILGRSELLLPSMPIHPSVIDHFNLEWSQDTYAHFSGPITYDEWLTHYIEELLASNDKQAAGGKPAAHDHCELVPICFDEDFRRSLGKQGVSLENPGNRMVHVGTRIEPPVSLHQIDIWGSPVTIGAFSYFGSGHLYNATVGRYCSIGNGLRVGASQHPLDHLTTSPVTYLDFLSFEEFVAGYEGAEWERALPAPYDFEPSAHTVIGNDVWIGTDVYIKDGVNIGDGAIIGAHAVVTKDVEPYAVMVGNPALIIKKRFSDNIIEALIELKWWKYNLFDFKNVDARNVAASIERIRGLAEECIIRPYSPPFVDILEARRSFDQIGNTRWPGFP